MTITVDRLFEDALCLSGEGRVALAEKLMESVQMDPDLLAEQLAVAKARADDLDDGRVQPVPGIQGLKDIRAAIEARAKA